ncbi:hypothetical protein TL18_09220 [Methanobrevibacter sp. YE315]|uniref:hypothetical protein n=1 Tax=Methanobrevibacter sp. YE315 TaxID=1609968 RepID=UPI000764D7F2|nr:hypothetical protein [Methanobrevibacter sp. YE315]AMD18178.1 hypothetical protein TL18_09220 [Methanobrevibacter sp. YE315]
MECYYHPDRESTDKCAICGKSICKECGLEISKKVYCKECLEKIIGLEIDKSQTDETISQDSIQTEEPDVTLQDLDDNIYQPQSEDIDFEEPYAPQEDVPSKSFSGISEDSPYNIRSNIEYSGGLESSYPDELYEKVEEPAQVTPDEINVPNEIPAQEAEDDAIYPDHDYEPPLINEEESLEDKYARYLDDLYFDEVDVPLNEQLAKDEAQYGSLTRREYEPKKEAPVEQREPGQKKAPKEEIPKEMETKLKPEILDDEKNIIAEDDKNIHNLNYNSGKEPMGVIDILLTIILIIVILIVVYYLIYLFILNTSYPTFLDALFALKNPQNVINNILAR